MQPTASETVHRSPGVSSGGAISNGQTVKNLCKQPLAFLPVLCYTLHRKIEYDSRCLFARFRRTEKGKREAGANPARSRHCDKEACRQGAFAPVTGHQPGKAAVGVDLSARKPARCRVRGRTAPNHEELVVPQRTC